MIAPNKYKGILYLTLLVVILPLCAYWLAIKQSVDIIFDMSKKQETISQLDHNGEKHKPKSELSLSSNDIIQSGIILDKIFTKDSTHNVEVAKYTPYLTFGDSNISIYTAELTLKGDFISILKVIDNVERNIPECTLSSLLLRTIIDRQSNTKQLFATLYIQQIVKN